MTRAESAKEARLACKIAGKACDVNFLGKFGCDGELDITLGQGPGPLERVPGHQKKPTEAREKGISASVRVNRLTERATTSGYNGHLLSRPSPLSFLFPVFPRLSPSEHSLLSPFEPPSPLGIYYDG